ncbi:MAG: PLP-dependent aminotransferase family protein [Alphaproteobacteria bacterium]|jgi:2-aminoadipate transaminase|nr:PLP-dependent aminotransferase family protein [Alphaproteobacteria bacterium]MBT5389273.1 PLP-dependent aminotransferase family protein [Alphaproteobacteria bacterium]
MTMAISSWLQSQKPSELQKALKSTGPDFISMALGLPSPDLFPVNELTACISSYTDPLFFQYSPQSDRLKEQVLSIMEKRGSPCKKEHVFITSAAQQGISMLCSLLLGKEKAVLTEELSYPGFIQAIAPHQPKIQAVLTHDKTGIDIEHLKQILQSSQKFAFLYLIGNGHNPLGINLSSNKKKVIAEIAAEYELPIIEDDAYGFISYTPSTPPIRYFNENQTLYIGSFSKIISPGLRAGWLVVPEYLLEKLSIIKESLDINTQTIGQRIVSTFIAEHPLESHIEKICSAYREKRNALLHFLDLHLSQYLTYHPPEAGFFVWAKLKEKIPASTILKLALQKGICFVPGNYFSPTESSKHMYHLRLNFSFPTIQQLEAGVLRLKQVMQELERKEVS